jgi:hypothetical protein
MLKDILKTSGVQRLSNLNQQKIHGGRYPDGTGPLDADCKWPLRRNAFGRCSIFG